MNFFALQDKARKQTRFLVFLFILAVFAIALTTNLIFFIAAKMQTTMPLSLNAWLAQPYWLIISAATLILIIGASLWRSWQLKTTPDAIAKMVNASPVSLASKSPQEKILVNVVEEMSIASGMTIPKIFIMREEQGMNAFVAGLDPSSVSLVVTQGLLDQLNRQELQGVIAHEYSHIFHGDMRINVRLIGVLAGILIIGQLGAILLRSGSYGSRGYRRSSSNKNSGNAAAIMLVGAGLFAVGYIGLFFGRLIKAAISRQREFLADASAVQYTRDKEGIASALDKIASFHAHSLLNTNKAEEMSHLCFGESVKQSVFSLLATHPPIPDRIKAINPGFIRRKTYKKSSSNLNAKPEVKVNPAAQAFDGSSVENNLDGLAVSQLYQANPQPIEFKPSTNITTNNIIASIGEISPQQIVKVKNLLSSIPKHLLDIAQAKENNKSSYLMVIALLMVNRKESVTIQTIRYDELESINLEKTIQDLSQLNFQQQHCLLDLSLARIEQQPKADNRSFAATLARLTSSQKETTLTEFMIYASAIKRALLTKNKNNSVGKFKLIQQEIIVFFNLLYQQSHLTIDEKQNQFKRQMKLFGIKPSKNNLTNFASPSFDTDSLRQALNKIARLNPLLKGEFFQSCIDIVNNDGEITKNEYELLRILGEYLDSPLPISPNI